jgi:hypothetical protein
MKSGGIASMLRDFAWDTFEHTGSIESYIFFKELEKKVIIPDDQMIAEQEAAISNA